MGQPVDVTIPGNTPNGQHWLGIIADVNNQFPESDETNNIAFDSGGVLINAEASEPNDSIIQSWPLGGPGPATLTWNGFVCPEGDVDFFSFEQSLGSLITIDLTTLPVNADLALYDANGSLLATSANGGTLDENITFTATYSGTYHVEIRGATGTEADARNSYTLTIAL